jgi:hypothetical protein
MVPGYLRIEDFAEAADLTVGTLYQYRYADAYEVPPPDLRIGIVGLWKQETVTAWVRKHKKRTRR